MTNFSHGRAAEEAAAKYLRKQGYEILDRNWKTRWCEIDIVAKRKKVIYFVEVKYRVGDTQGTGLDYITPKKLKSMRFAAELWITEHKWDGDYNLGAIEISGADYLVGEFLPVLEVV